MRKIEITFDENGDPTVDALGFADNQCKQATAPFENAMGLRAKVKDKAEGQRVKRTVKVTS